MENKSDFSPLKVIDFDRFVIHICITMKTATVRDLRSDFRRVSAWIENGEAVEIIKRGKPFARLTPAAQPSKRLVKIDFKAQLKQVWGDRVFSDAEIRAMRDAEDEV